jgi:hypothetical protein
MMIRSRRLGLVAALVTLVTFAACSRTSANHSASTSTTVSHSQRATSTTSKAAPSSTEGLQRSSTTTTRSSVALPRVYSVGCPGENPPTMEPSEIPLACADYGEVFTGITWSSWTATSAHGTGTYSQNDCTPDCASGTFHSYPTSIVLSDPQQSHTQGLIFGLITTNTPTGPKDTSGPQDIGPDRCANDTFVHDC